MAASRKYKTIALDWDGTCSNSRFWQHWLATRAYDYGLIQQRLFAERPDLVMTWMRGDMTAEQVVEYLALHTQLAHEDLLTGLVESSRSMTFVSDQVPALVGRLRQTGYRVVIATDNMDTFPRWTVPAMGLIGLFDDILDSHTLRGLKGDRSPDGESIFFARYLSSTQSTYGECLLIDNSTAIAAAVRDFGIDVLEVRQGFDVVTALKTLL